MVLTGGGKGFAHDAPLCYFNTPRSAPHAVAGLSIASIAAPGKATDYVKVLQGYPALNALVKFGSESA